MFPVFWCAVLFLLSVLGGWRALARAYASETRPAGRTFSFRSGSFGFVNYGGCLSFASGPAGLYVAVFPLFRPGHPPFLVPWHDISAKAKEGWLLRFVDLRFARQPHIRLRVSRGLAEHLLGAAGGVVRLEEAA
jgi:hypothetical protein